MKQGYGTTPFAERRAKLKSSFRKGHLVVAPGVFEMVSARMADTMGFEALYMTGYGTVASYLGMPDAGLATFTDMVDRVSRYTQITDTPLICDGDTGYGGLLNLMHTVRGYERAGACAIQIEDQQSPKKCGHMLGRVVVPADEMINRVRVAAETRDDKNFMIIARTDARTTHGLDEALRRMEKYARAGADILFVESPESEEEMRRICESFDLPCLANMVEGGRTPVLSREALLQIGYGVAIYPSAAFLAAGAAFKSVYTTLKETGSSAKLDVPVHDFQAFSRMMGFDWVSEFDAAHAAAEQGK